MDAYSLGQFLRDARESRQIELDDAVAALKIRRPILEAFESGEFAVAGLSEIQARGMLRNYARFLQLDEDDVLRLYSDARFGKRRRGRWGWRRRAAADRRRERVGIAKTPMQEIDVEQLRAARRRRWMRLIGLLAFSAAAFAVIAFVVSELIAGSPSDEARAATATAALAGLDEATVTLAPSTPTPTAVPPTPSNRALYAGSGVLASILTTQRNWIRISSDGVEQYAGIAVPGTLLEYRANNEILVTASNALGLDIVWNGQPQGRIGDRGQRVDLRFNVDEVAISLGPPGAPTPLSPTVPVTATDTATATATSAAAIVTATPADAVVEAEAPQPAATMARDGDAERYAAAQCDASGDSDADLDRHGGRDTDADDFGDLAAAGDASGFAADEGGGVTWLGSRQRVEFHRSAK